MLCLSTESLGSQALGMREIRSWIDTLTLVRGEERQQVIHWYSLRCHHGDHGLKAPQHVWTASYPEFIRQTGQIFGDFNDLLPSTWINKINKLRDGEIQSALGTILATEQKTGQYFTASMFSLIWSVEFWLEQKYPSCEEYQSAIELDIPGWYISTVCEQLWWDE